MTPRVVIAALALGGCWGGSPTPPAAPPPTEVIEEGLPAPRATPPEAAPSPLAQPADAELERVRAYLTDVVRRFGLDLENPWALGHALVALGGEVTLPDGRPAVDALVARWGRFEPLPGRPGVAFPGSVGAIRVEPHRDLVLKALADSGVGPDHPLTVEGRPATAADLWRSALGHTWLDGDQPSAGSWNDTAWTLFGVAGWAPEGLAWTTHGRAVTLDALTHAAVARLVADTAFMDEARRAGQPLVKRGQGLFAYTCGGAHFLQGAALAVARGFGEPGDAAAMRAQAELLAWRFGEELRVTDEALASHPEYQLILLVQRLKFVGHFLETMHRMAALGLVEDGAAIRGVLARGRIELVRTVDALRAAGAWDRMDAIRAQREQTWLDLIGDAAHALRGLELSTGDAVAWR